MSNRPTEFNGPNVNVSKVYYPHKEGIKFYYSRIKHCPVHFPASFYWYGRMYGVGFIFLFTIT